MKKTGVLFTISSVNFELKQGKEYIEQNIFSEFSAWVWARLSLSLSLSPLRYKAAVAAI